MLPSCFCVSGKLLLDKIKGSNIQNKPKQMQHNQHRRTTVQQGFSIQQDLGVSQPDLQQTPLKIGSWGILV